MGPIPTAAELRLSARCARWTSRFGLQTLGLVTLGLGALGLGACSSDDGRPPPPVSGIGTDEDPSLTDDDGGGARDAGADADAGRSDGGEVPTDAGPKPDAPPGDDPSVRRLVVSDRAGAILVYDVRETSPELPAPTRLDVDAGAHVVAGASGRYAYVFVPGSDEVRVLDVGMHVEGGRNVLSAPALLDLTLSGDAVAGVAAGSSGAPTDLAVSFSGASAPLFVSEAALASAAPAEAWPAGSDAHRALAFFVGDLALRSVSSAGATSLEVVGRGAAGLDCAEPSSVVAYAEHALVGCADGLHVLARSAAGVDSARVAAASSFQLGAANPRAYAVASADTLLAAPWTADGGRGFEATLGDAPVAIQLAGPEKNVGVWVLDAAGTLELYDAAHPAGTSEIATGCATPSDGARPQLLVEGTLAYFTCPATGKLVARSLSDASSEPVLADAGSTPSDLLMFGYAP